MLVATRNRLKCYNILVSGDDEYAVHLYPEPARWEYLGVPIFAQRL